MKTADICIGVTYAVKDQWSNAFPAEPVELLGKGIVRLRVLESHDGPSAGQLLEMHVRAVISPWEDWLTTKAEMDAARNARNAQWQYEDVLDCRRPLPASYQPLSGMRNDAFVERMAETAPLRPYEKSTILKLLQLTPGAVSRDVLAAYLDATPEHAPTSAANAAHPRVNEVFTRTVEVLRCGLDHRTVDLEQLNALDVDAFVTACKEGVAADGGCLHLPSTPNLGHSATSDTTPTTGWMRIAYGETSGLRMHDPTCPSLRRPSAIEAMLEAPSVPRWHLTFADRECGRCGGPGLAPTPRLVAFIAAADVWQARQDTPEPWQVRALLYLIAEAAEQRAAQGEPDVTLLARIADTCSALGPPPNGFAFAAVNPFSRYAADESDRLESLVDLNRRLHAINELLPDNLRPDVPFPLDNTGPDGSPPISDTTILLDLLRRWWAAVENATNIEREVLAFLVLHVRWG